MQIVLYNPHIDDFFYKPVIYKLLNRRPLKKYGFFTKTKNLSVYVDGTESGILPFSIFKRLPVFLKNLFLKLEIYFWKKLNNDSKIKFLKSPTSNHLLIMMSYKSANNMTNERVKNLNNFKFVIAHLSHYFINTKKKSLNLSKLNNLYLAGDSNILKNKYFKTFFDWYDKSFVVLPFAISERWEKRIPFNDRKKFLIATGTVHDLKNEKPKYLYEDFLNISGLNYYHPTRIEAHEICKELGFTSYVNQYRGNKSNLFSLFFKRLIISQKKYFSIDLTKEYNKHNFAIVGEEWSGFPALGAFEAIACGAVLIGDSSKYVDTGLKEDLHYIPIDKNLTNTIDKIKLLSNSSLNKISNQGSNFIKTNFNSNSVMLTWLKNLEKISKYFDEEDF